MPVNTAREVVQPQTFDLAKFIVDNWLNILFGVIGAIGTVLTIVSLRSSQKDKRSYKFLLDLAEKNIDKNITEAQLREKKEEVEKAVVEIERLQAQIKKDIPLEARKAVLRDKLNSHYTELTSTYKNVQTVKNELVALGISEEMPPELMKEIEKEISPQYLLKEERENLMTYLTVFMGLSTIASAILPWEISRVIASLCLLVSLVFIIPLVKNVYASTSHKNQIRLTMYGAFIGFITAAIIFITNFIIYSESNRTYHEDFIIKTFLLLFMSVGLVILFASLKLYKLKVRLVNQISNNLNNTPS